MTTASQAIDQIKPKLWATTPIPERLRLLEAVRENIKIHADELAKADADMKNGKMGESIFGIPESKVATVVPIANTITASVDLYEHLAKGEMPKPISVEQVADDTYKVQVFPQTGKEKVMAGRQKGYLYIKGKPEQTNPMDKPAGIIGVLGAGNYSSSLEMVKAMFFDNKAVVHKPHHNNIATDAIWEKIFQPLIEVGAIAFCDADQGQALTEDNRLTSIYFTGGTGTAKAIMSQTDTPLVSECGGNNPCVIVPGDRPWTDKEMHHQVVQIATVAKMNGGAVCGRPQTIITSKHWSQRDEFLRQLEKSINEDTPSAGTYYQGSDKAWEGFADAYPDAKILQPEGGKYNASKFMLIEGAEIDSYATQNEAFCQIIGEVPLDVPARADAFIPTAIEFCNNKLLGTLGACLLIDEDTKKAHQDTLDKALLDWHYGGIAVNNMPPFVFFSPYLTWGGNEQREGQEFVSGYGNFGNLLGFDNIEKSVIIDSFMSPGHFMNTNKANFDHLANSMANFAVHPSWINIIKMLSGAVVGQFKKKDF